MGDNMVWVTGVIGYGGLEARGVPMQHAVMHFERAGNDPKACCGGRNTLSIEKE